jgi:hypothetical protein
VERPLHQSYQFSDERIAAVKVIKKVHKGKAPQPLYGLFQEGGRVLECQADSELRDNENVALDLPKLSDRPSRRGSLLEVWRQLYQAANERLRMISAMPSAMIRP